MAPSKTVTKASGKEPASKQAAGKKGTVAKTTAKSPAKKASAKHVAGKTSPRKYSPAASAQVGEELHEMHEGKLHIGTSDKLVTNPKQAIAIGLAEARRAGKKVPPNPNHPSK